MIDEIEANARVLESAVVLLRRLPALWADEDSRPAARAQVQILLKVREVERWADGEFQEIMDELADMGIGVPRQPE